MKGERVYCDLIAEWQMILFHHLKFLKIAISDNHVKTMFFFRIFLNTVSDLEARVNGGYNDKPNCRYLFYKLSVDNSIYPESPWLTYLSILLYDDCCALYLPYVFYNSQPSQIWVTNYYMYPCGWVRSRRYDEFIWKFCKFCLL